MDFNQAFLDMLLVEQGPKENMLQHGVNVAIESQRLIDAIRRGNDLSRWRIEKLTSQQLQFLIAHINPYELAIINIFHDIGKPQVLFEDEKGKHYPHYYFVSKEILMPFFKENSLEVVDFDNLLHKSNPEVVRMVTRYLAERDKLSVIAMLIITSFAACRANMDLFGGENSDSFKIKCRRVEQRAKTMFKEIYV